MIDLKKYLKPGKKFYCVFGGMTDHPYTQLWHILAVIDDQIVFKFWSKNKRCWIYHIEPRVFFTVYNRSGLLKK